MKVFSHNVYFVNYVHIHHHPSIEFIFVLFFSADSRMGEKNSHYNTHGILYSLHGVKKWCFLNAAKRFCRCQFEDLKSFTFFIINTECEYITFIY